MRLRQILTHQVPVLLAHLILFADDFDTSSARSTSWFQNIKVFKVIHFSIVLPPFVIFWEDVSQRTELEFFTMLSPLFLDISP